MITVFWDCEGMILVNAMQRGETITHDTYIRALTELRKRFRGIRPDKNPTEILFQHDSARLHTSLKTQEAIPKFGWTVLPHQAYSHDLSPSDFQISGALNDAIHGMKFETDKDVICATCTCTWLCLQGPRSGRRLWYGVNLSLFIMCSFHDLGTNAWISGEKIRVVTFCANFLHWMLMSTIFLGGGIWLWGYI